MRPIFFSGGGAHAARASHHPNPAEAKWRWRGERSEPVRLSFRDPPFMLRLRRKSSAKSRRSERIRALLRYSSHAATALKIVC